MIFFLISWGMADCIVAKAELHRPRRAEGGGSGVVSVASGSMRRRATHQRLRRFLLLRRRFLLHHFPSFYSSVLFLLGF